MENDAREISKSLLSKFWLVLMPFSFIGIFLSMFMFDASGSEGSLLTKILAFSMTTAPVSLFLGGVAAKTTKYMVFLPFLNLFVFVAALTGLIVFCDGQFSCWL